ncbi:hypothetical protein ABK040_000975 [Willaertia magna]
MNAKKKVFKKYVKFCLVDRFKAPCTYIIKGLPDPDTYGADLKDIKYQLERHFYKIAQSKTPLLINNLEYFENDKTSFYIIQFRSFTHYLIRDVTKQNQTIFQDTFKLKVRPFYYPNLHLHPEYFIDLKELKKRRNKSKQEDLLENNNPIESKISEENSNSDNKQF